MRLSVLTIAAAMAAAAPAYSATNLGFEEGDLTNWTVVGNGVATTGLDDVTAYEGDFFAAIEAGQMGVYTTLSRTFQLLAGGTISGHVGFKGREDEFAFGQFDDKAELTVNGVPLFQSSIVQLGSATGFSGWVPFTYTAATAGSYELQLGVANFGDSSLSSVAVLDDVSITGEAAVPEPASWAMMVMGFGLAGAILRGRRTAVSFA